MEESEEQRARRFNEELIKFYNNQGKDSFKHPIVSGKNLDLYKLYNEVIRLGGYQSVLENKQWKDVVTILDLPSSCTSASFTVKRHYKKYLLAYEQTFNKTSLDAKLNDREDGIIKNYPNHTDIPSTLGANQIQKNNNINNINIPNKQIIGQPSTIQEKNFLQKKVMRNEPELNFFFRNPTGGYIYLKDKSSINKTIRILSAIPDMKRIELAFESHITSEIYWAINVLLIFSSNTNKDINTKKDILDEKKDEEKFEVQIDEKLLEQNKNIFTIKQKISLILFIVAFILMIVGILVWDWWFEHMTAVFLILAIIFMFMFNEGEKKGIDCFLRGAGDFIGVTLVIGIARGINLTLNEGKISDTIMNSLSNAVEGLPPLAFAIILFILFIVLGIFIQSSSGMAILSMPVFAPLADKVGLSRATTVNTYMFGQYLAACFTPTGLILITLSMVQIEYIYWIKFIWPFLIILFVFLLFFVMISVYVD